MAKNCITCGAGFTGSERELALHFKRQFETNGIVRYVYRLNASEGFKFVRAKHYNEIFETQIKPNLENGAEHFHIAEFK